MRIEIALSAFLLLLAGCESRPDKPNVTAVNDITGSENIKTIIKDFTDVFNSGDTAKFAAFFPTFLDKDAEYMPPNEPRITGKAINNFFLGFARQYTLDIKFSDEEFFAGGNWGFHRYTYDLVATPRTGGEPYIERGHGVHIFRLQSDGSWKLAKDVWSVPPK